MAYPTACLSAYCGKIECPATCRYLPALLALKRDRNEQAAKVPRVWRPTHPATVDAGFPAEIAYLGDHESMTDDDGSARFTREGRQTYVGGPGARYEAHRIG